MTRDNLLFAVIGILLGFIVGFLVVAIGALVDAADSAEGIQQWWLSPAGCSKYLDVVENALRWLEKTGSVAKTEVGGTVIYRKATR